MDSLKNYTQKKGYNRELEDKAKKEFTPKKVFFNFYFLTMREREEEEDPVEAKVNETASL